MHNPFVESRDDVAETLLIEQVREGSRDALAQLVLRHQAWIYNIALRMVFQPQDAEEVTQEVLIKAITRLGTFRGECQFRTWLYRIAANHVLNMRRRGGESTPITFGEYGEAINATPDLDPPDPHAIPVDQSILVEEAKLACTTGMLMCLDRRQRLAFVLGEVLGASDTVASEILEITDENFRQLLSRARRDLSQFMRQQCGLVDPANPCRCRRKTQGFMLAGHIDPGRLMFATRYVHQIRDIAPAIVRRIDDLIEQSATDVFRQHPFLEPGDHLAWLKELLQRDDVRTALQFD